MQPSILIASPDAQFAEPLLRKLEGTGDYHVRWVHNGREALNLTSRLSFDVLILDTSLSDLAAATLHNLITEMDPDLHILEYPGAKAEEAESEAVEEPVEESRQAFIQSLADVLDRSPAELSPEQASSTPANLDEQPGSPWLQERDRTAQILVSFLMETKAHAAMLVWQGAVFASAGDLEKAALDEILTLVNRDWNGGSRVDLTRFIRLRGGTRYCLYAAPLAEGILVVVQELSIPFSQVRMQTAQLAYVLSELPELPASHTETIPKELDGGAFALPDVEEIDYLGSVEADQHRTAGENDQEPTGEMDFELDEAKAMSLAELLASMPPPNPQDDDEMEPVADLGMAFQPEGSTETDDEAEARLPWDTYETEGQPTPVATQPDLDDAMPQLTPVDEAADTLPMATELPTEETIRTPLEHPAVDELIDTIAVVAAAPEAAEQEFELTQVYESEFVFNRLAYTCVLIPRLPKQALTGEVAESIREWVPALCIAFGWKLASMTLQPEYLMWSVRVEANESPSHLVRLLRRQTSQRLFTSFNHLKDQNPSDDFWAPGYLVIAGMEPPAPQWLQRYITQTRHRQGLPVSQ
ncbi:MAG: hypothetical protein HPY76_14315 [Anaerolineae bacterium]|nr:hypothetical protein [Anaerolineae bacterium]